MDIKTGFVSNATTTLLPCGTRVAIGTCHLLLLTLLAAPLVHVQTLVAQKHDSYPSNEANHILTESCRAVSKRLGVPPPDPNVKLLLGHKFQTILSVDGLHTIQLYRWNKDLFKVAAVAVCLRSAETSDFVSQISKVVSDY